MKLGRVLQHLILPAWQVRRAFPPQAMRAIEAAIGESERLHHGQICFAVEAALELRPLLADQPARGRALDVFALQRVWDTTHKNGVLIYVLLADHDVEIIADRGIDAQVHAAEWKRICRGMEEAFRAGLFEQGAVTGVRAVGALLARHYPGRGSGGNELSNAPIIV